MRGGLDDALARMARREELRRRTEGSPQPPSPSPGAAVEEVVQAARRAVERDHELSVTVQVTYRGRTSAVRVEQRDGEVMVTVDQGSSAPPPPPPPPPAAPPPPAPPPSAPPPSSPPPAQPSAAAQLAELLRQETR